MGNTGKWRQSDGVTMIVSIIITLSVSAGGGLIIKHTIVQ